MKKYLILLTAFLLLNSCDDKDGDDRVYYNSDIISIVSDTDGGGDIRFQISQADNGYTIHVSEYSYLETSQDISLLNNDVPEYNLVKQIFNREIDIYDEVDVPQGETGTWTSVTINYKTGESVKIDNINTFGTLKILYDFVRNNVLRAVPQNRF